MILNEIKNAFSSSTYHYESLKEKSHKELKLTFSHYSTWNYDYANYIPLDSITYITTNYTTSTSMAEPSGRLYYMDVWDNTLRTTN